MNRSLKWRSALCCAAIGIFRCNLRGAIFAASIASASLLLCGLANATTYNEIGDAGQTLSTYQVVPAGTNSIYGQLSFVPDFDIYGLIFGTTANVAVMIPNPGSTSEDDWFDTDVTIFDGQGHPLYCFDGTSFSFPVEPGLYLFAMADWNVYAADASGNNIADDITGTLDRNAVFDHFVVNSSPYRIGDYQINFSIATVPEPSTLALAVLALTALPLRRRI